MPPTAPQATSPVAPIVMSMTSRTARPLGMKRRRRAHMGWRRPASAAAARIQPSTRCECETMRSAAKPAPNSTTASTADRGVRRSRSIGWGGPIGRYSTGVAAGDSVTPVPAPSTTGPAPAGAGGVVRLVDLDWRSVLVVLGAFVGLLAVTGIVRETPRTVTALVIAAIIALATDPVVRWVQRTTHVGRSGSVAMVVVVFVAALSGLAALIVPPAVHQAKQLRKQLPHVVHEIGRLPVIGHPLEKADVPAKVQKAIQELPDKLSRNTAPLT